jgi:hypothetical protein
MYLFITSQNVNARNQHHLMPVDVRSLKKRKPLTIIFWSPMMMSKGLTLSLPIYALRVLYTVTLVSTDFEKISTPLRVLSFFYICSQRFSYLRFFDYFIQPHRGTTVCRLVPFPGPSQCAESFGFPGPRESGNTLPYSVCLTNLHLLAPSIGRAVYSFAQITNNRPNSG